MRENIALITGAEGFIGSHLVEYLHAKGWTVIGACRSAEFNGTPRSPKIQFVQCDLQNGQRITQLFSRYEPTHIFHLGAQSLPTASWADPVSTFETNIMGSLYLFEAVRYMKHFPIVVSACSSAEYGRVPPDAIPVTEEQPLKPLHPYGISKVCLDLLARQYFLDYKIPAVNLRIFNTTGPGKTNDAPSDFVRQLVGIKKRLQPPIIEVGNLIPRRAFLHVNDTVRGFYLAAMNGKPGEAYNLCATRTYQIREILNTAIRLAGVRAKIRPVRRLMRPSDEPIIFGSAKKILKDTGWKPLLSIEDILSSMLEYWNQIV
jgi:GDP-4-dehydro-6-deoxy-D-mannose reductase